MDCAVAFDARSELELMTLCNAALQDEHRDAPQLERARCSLLWGHGKQIQPSHHNLCVHVSTRPSIVWAEVRPGPA